MDDTRKIESVPPLGRSVEDVEHDNQNRENPPARDTPDRTTGADFKVAPLPTVNATANGVQGSIAGMGAPIVGTYGLRGSDDAASGSETDDTTENTES